MCNSKEQIIKETTCSAGIEGIYIDSNISNCLQQRGLNPVSMSTSRYIDKRPVIRKVVCIDLQGLTPT